MVGPRKPLESPLARYAVLVAGSVGALCLQSVLARRWPWIDVSPVPVVFFALELDLVPGMVVTFIVAHVADALSGGPPGLMASGLLGAFLGLRGILRRRPSATPPVLLVLTLLAFLSAAAVRALAHGALGPDAPLPSPSGWRLVSALAAAIPLHGALRWMSEPFRPREDLGLRR